MGTAYEVDVVAWANEQAALLRAGEVSALDLLNLAEEIEDVGKSEQRELASRLSVLLAHLLKWQFQPARRSPSWRATIGAQRAEIAYHLSKAPSLRPRLADAGWMNFVWKHAVARAIKETRLADFPAQCIWSPEQILDDTYLPDASE